MGAAVWGGGVPSLTLRRRCAAAAELWAQGGIDRVIPSGGLGANPPSEAEVMAALLVEGGVPAGFITLEDQATTTMETAFLVARMVPPDARITVVSDRYHLARCRLAFRAAGHRVHVASAHGAEPRPRLRVSAKAWMREAAGLAAYSIRILFRQG